MLWVRIPFRRSVLDITLCAKVCQWLATDLCFSPGTSVSSINKTDRHDIQYNWTSSTNFIFYFTLAEAYTSITTPQTTRRRMQTTRFITVSTTAAIVYSTKQRSLEGNDSVTEDDACMYIVYCFVFVLLFVFVCLFVCCFFVFLFLFFPPSNIDRLLNNLLLYNNLNSPG